MRRLLKRHDLDEWVLLASIVILVFIAIIQHFTSFHH